MLLWVYVIRHVLLSSTTFLTEPGGVVGFVKILAIVVDLPCPLSLALIEVETVAATILVFGFDFHGFYLNPLGVCLAFRLHLNHLAVCFDFNGFHPNPIGLGSSRFHLNPIGFVFCGFHINLISFGFNGFHLHFVV